MRTDPKSSQEFVKWLNVTNHNKNECQAANDESQRIIRELVTAMNSQTTSRTLPGLRQSYKNMLRGSFRSDIYGYFHFITSWPQSKEPGWSLVSVFIGPSIHEQKISSSNPVDSQPSLTPTPMVTTMTTIDEKNAKFPTGYVTRPLPTGRLQPEICVLSNNGGILISSPSDTPKTSCLTYFHPQNDVSTTVQCKANVMADCAIKVDVESADAILFYAGGYLRLCVLNTGQVRDIQYPDVLDPCVIIQSLFTFGQHILMADGTYLNVFTFYRKLYEFTFVKRFKLNQRSIQSTILWAKVNLDGFMTLLVSPKNNGTRIVEMRLVPDPPSSSSSSSSMID
jgi:hypothetical protein